MPQEPAAGGSVSDRLSAASASISPAERKVAQIVAVDPELVAFGTVAEVAERAGTSGASVVRLADRLGYAGYRGLQDAVRTELRGRLRPATEKIRRPATGDLVGVIGAAAAAAIHDTFSSVRPADVDAAVGLLARRGRRVLVLAGDAGSGVALQAATSLSMLRDGVEQLSGSAIGVGRVLSRAAGGDVLLCIDLPRHDRWVLEAVEAARERGVQVIAVTDSPLSPLARGAEVVFAVGSHDVGPFDSYVAALAVVEVLVAGVAQRVRSTAAAHLDTLEALWESMGAIDPD